MHTYMIWHGFPPANCTPNLDDRTQFFIEFMPHGLDGKTDTHSVEDIEHAVHMCYTVDDNEHVPPFTSKTQITLSEFLARRIPVCTGDFESKSSFYGYIGSFQEGDKIYTLYGRRGFYPMATGQYLFALDFDSAKRDGGTLKIDVCMPSWLDLNNRHGLPGMIMQVTRA